MRRVLFILFCFVSIVSFSFSQSTLAGTTHPFDYKKFDEDKLTALNFFELKKTELRLSPGSTFKLQKEIKGLSDTKHYRFKQYYQNIPVYGHSFILHERDGRVSHTNGNYLSEIDLNTQANISTEKAIELAKDHMQVDALTKLPSPKLFIVDAHFPKRSKDYRLAYVFELETKQPLQKREYIIDAHTGEYLYSFSKLFDIAVEGTGLTTYYGEQRFITDSIGPGKYILHDPSRGQGITTQTDINGSPEELEDADNFWDLTDIDHGSTAIDVHWGTQRFWDLLKNKLNWEGLDNLGKSMNPIVQVLSGSDFANAQWTGENALFGNGDCFHNSFTSLDVIGHEFTHGIIQETANLVPASESGAINESICDILGKSLEFYEDSDNFSWYLGERFVDSPFAEPFRNMANPKEFNDPNFYQGEFWTDCGTIHHNAGVGNYWFYLLAKGGSGINEIGESFSISPLGMENALRLVFTSLTAYLTENARYFEYYLASLQAAEDLFGVAAPEIDIVRDAWHAVGVREGVSVVSGIELLVDFDNPFQSTVNYFCESGALYQDTVLIINSGTEDYRANMFAQLKLAFGPNSYFKTIDVDVPAGDTALLSINDIVPIDFDGRRNLIATIELEQNQVECLATVLVVLQNSTITERDVRITSLYRSTPCDNDRGLVYSIRLNNLSCQEIPTDTKFTVRAFDAGSLIYEEEMETFLNIGQGSLTSFELELDYETLSGEDIVVEVLLDGDTNPDNNTTTLIYRESQAILDNQYLNTFSTAISPFNQLKYDTRTQISEPFIYQGESYFASSSRLENPDAAFCNIPEEYFNGGLSSAGKTTQLSMCVDLEGFVSSTLKFDLIQFRNDTFEHKDLITSSAMKVIINGENQFLEDHIYDLNEGEQYFYSYDLEPHFKGNITLQFFNRSGVAIDSPAFLEYDVILMDNLEIVEGLTHTDETSMQKSAQIFPNPSTGIFKISSSKRIKQVEIFNTQGTLIQKHTEHPDELYIPDNGYYLLRIEYQDQNQDILPFIKLD